jgi:hypothetical protein
VVKNKETQSNALAQCAVKNAESLEPQATHIALAQCAVAGSKTQPVGQCAHCGGDFVKRTTWQKYCQEACRDEAQFLRTGKRPWRHAKLD